jgi:hypothetical protein
MSFTYYDCEAERDRLFGRVKHLRIALALIAESANSKQPATRIKNYVARVAGDALAKDVKASSAR